MGQLIGRQVRWLAPRYLSRMLGRSRLPETARRRVRALASGIPRPAIAQLRALAKTAGVDADTLLAANLAPELKSALACSCIATGPKRSPDGKVRLARNLDWPAGDLLAGLELVMVEQGPGIKRFASFGWPGMIGVVSGMNEAGLSIADLMAYPGGRLRIRHGMPVMFVLRTLLERTSSVKQALAALKGFPRTMPQNYALADAREAVALESGPRHFRPRPARDGLALITNYYDEDQTQKRRRDRRYPTMLSASGSGKHALDVAKLITILGKVALDKLNVQSVVFVPADHSVHLAVGSPPVARGRWIRLDLAEWLGSD
jgi:hypothetical protein